MRRVHARQWSAAATPRRFITTVLSSCPPASATQQYRHAGHGIPFTGCCRMAISSISIPTPIVDQLSSRRAAQHLSIRQGRIIHRPGLLSQTAFQALVMAGLRQERARRSSDAPAIHRADCSQNGYVTVPDDRHGIGRTMLGQDAPQGAAHSMDRANAQDLRRASAEPRHARGLQRRGDMNDQGVGPVSPMKLSPSRSPASTVRPAAAVRTTPTDRHHQKPAMSSASRCRERAATGTKPFHRRPDHRLQQPSPPD